MKIYALRGAIQLQEDSAAAMEMAVGRLVAELSAKNCIEPSRIIHIVFSQTDDLRNANPATAIRKGGFDKAPLFCTREPEYPDSLPRTLRVLLLCKAPIWSRAFWCPPVHCYLDGAAALRPDLSYRSGERSQ